MGKRNVRTLILMKETIGITNHNTGNKNADDSDHTKWIQNPSLIKVGQIIILSRQRTENILIFYEASKTVDFTEIFETECAVCNV